LRLKHDYFCLHFSLAKISSKASPSKDSIAKLKAMEAELSAQDIILYRRMARAKMPAKAKAKSWLKGISTWFSGNEVHQEEVRAPLLRVYLHCCVFNILPQSRQSLR
jgi:hypothetical protein